MNEQKVGNAIIQTVDDLNADVVYISGRKMIYDG